jgi:hypothetical protein
MRNADGEQLIPFEVALQLADRAVFAKTGKHLRNIDIAVLRGALLSQKYDDIADEIGYAPEYLKHDVGPKLWQLLSLSLGEKVNKNNLMAVLARQKQYLSQETSIFTESPVVAPSWAFKLPIGSIDLDSSVYIERTEAENLCYREITRSGALIRIKAPAQMGKTSLMVRILDRARQQEIQYHTVPLSLDRADKEAFSNLDRFLRWFCAAVTRKLQLSHSVEDYWSDTFGSKSNCTAYFEDCLLSTLNAPLVLALDRVDEIFLHPEIADDFFALLRSWYEEAAYGDSGNPLWRNLRLIIVHSTEVYIPLEINQSPFNVGLAIELQPFTASQVKALSQRYGLSLTANEIERLMELIAGHPYLVQQAFYHLVKGDLTFSGLLETATTDAGIYGNHLHRYLACFQEHPQLAEAFDRVIQAEESFYLDRILAFKLHSMGLVKLQGDRILPSCALYQTYFHRNRGAMLPTG